MQIPIVTPVDDTRWKLVEDYSVTLSDGSLLVIPKDSITDGASVPRLFWSLIPTTGKYFGAAIAHDFLYKTKMFERKRCDFEFLYLMKKAGVPAFKRTLMYRAVRMFGEFSW